MGMVIPSNASIVWNALKKSGYNDFAVAGIMGNLFAESGLKPRNMQNAYERKLGFNDDTYTDAVDVGTYTAHEFINDHVGYGLAQWTFYSRKESLLSFAKSRSVSIGELNMQIDFLITELKGYTHVHNVLKDATNVRQASDIVLLEYEQPADCSEKVQELRCSYGNEFYTAFPLTETKKNLERTRLIREIEQTRAKLDSLISEFINACLH